MNWTVGIDLGAYGARMVAKDKDLVLNSSSACAMRGEKLIAIGDEARALQGRTTGAIRVLYPMAGGAVDNEEALRMWLKYLLHGTGGVVRSGRALIARPARMSASQKRLLSAMALECGASACALVRSDLCAALGVDEDLTGKRARLIVQVGASQISATLIAQMRLIAQRDLPYGLREADARVKQMLRERYELEVGLVTAEAVKNSLGSAMAASEMTETVTGLDLQSGFPRQKAVSAQDVAACIAPVLEAVPDLVWALVAEATSDVLDDLMEDGVVLVGGGAQVYGLAGRITERTGLKCAPAEEPTLAVARGLAKLLDAPDDYAFLTEEHQTLLEKRMGGALGGRA